MEYSAWEDGGEQGDPPRLKAYSDMAEKEQRFTWDIEKIVDTSIMPLTVEAKTESADRARKHTYLSGSNFLQFYDFAVALHGRNMPSEFTTEDMERKFTSHSLEYQLSTLNRARYCLRLVPGCQSLESYHETFSDRCWWWLRTPGWSNKYAAGVALDGNIRYGAIVFAALETVSAQRCG